MWMTKDGYRVGIFMPRLRLMARELGVSEEALASEIGRLVGSARRVGVVRSTRGARRALVFAPRRRPARRFVARSLNVGRDSAFAGRSLARPPSPPPRRPFGPPLRRYWPYWPAGLWPDYSIVHVEPAAAVEPLGDEPLVIDVDDAQGEPVGSSPPEDGADEPVEVTDEELDLLWRRS